MIVAINDFVLKVINIDYFFMYEWKKKMQKRKCFLIKDKINSETTYTIVVAEYFAFKFIENLDHFQQYVLNYLTFVKLINLDSITGTIRKVKMS